MRYDYLSKDKIDDALFDITLKLYKKHGVRDGNRMIEPLRWYVNTDRMSNDDLHKLCDTDSRQKSVIANRLAKSGSYEDAVTSVLEYIRN